MMKWICQKDDLLQGLSLAAKASDAHSPMQVLGCVYLCADSMGIRLTGTDLQLGITTTIPATVEEGGQILLPARLFSEVVRKLPSGEVMVTVSDTMSATLRAQGSKITLQGMPAQDFPVLPAVDEDVHVTLKQSLLRSMILKVGFAIAQDDARPILQGIYLEADGNDMLMVALDGFRLALRRGKLEEPVGAFSAVVAGKYLMEVGKLLEDSEETVDVYLSSSHMMLKIAQTDVIVRLMEGEYIKFRQLLPPTYAISSKMERGMVAECIERASLMAREGKSNLLRFCISQDTLAITANGDMGDAREEMPVETMGKDIDIAFNVRFVSDAVRNIDEEYFLLKMNSNITPCVLEPLEGDEFLYLVLPVRTAG